MPGGERRDMKADSWAAGTAAGAAGRPRDRHELGWHLTEQVQSVDQRRAVVTGHGSGADGRQGGGDPRQTVPICPAGRLGRPGERRRRVSAVAQPDECAPPDQATYLPRRRPRSNKLSSRHHPTNPRTAHAPTIPPPPDTPHPPSATHTRPTATCHAKSALSCPICPFWAHGSRDITRKVRPTARHRGAAGGGGGTGAGR